MSDNTGIEWTDATWNPVVGCTKVSPGCDHCYAKTMHERFNGPGSFDTVELRPERLDQPLRWRKPRRIFVNSMSDLFHKDVPDEYIARVFAVMAQAPQHTFQILTKRHARMRSLLNSPLFTNMLLSKMGAATVLWPLSNVWLGVSVESQQWADIRIPELLCVPAMVRFISAEPLLGPLALSPWLDRTQEIPNSYRVAPGQPVFGAHDVSEIEVAFYPVTLDWVIVGGESGREARPMEAEWARSLRDQCSYAGVPFLFKQWGEFGPRGWRVGSRDDQMVRMGKKNAGRELDGRTWDEYPELVSA